ncbi:MAG: tetratricopeptide repeat protein, partial [Deltaproteobacteria bacterium]
RLKQEKEELSFAQDKVAQRIKELEKQNTALQKQSAALASEKADLSSELEKQRRKPDQSASEMARLKERIAQLEAERDALKQKEAQNVSGRDEAERLRVQLNALTEQLRENKSRVEAQMRVQNEEQVRALNDKIAGIEKKLKEAQDFSYGLVQEKAAWQSAQKDLKAKIEGGQKEIAGLMDKLEVAEGGRRQMQDQIDALNKEKDSLAAKSAAESAQHEQEVTLLKTSMEQEIAQKDGTIVRLSAKVDELKSAQQQQGSSLSQKLDALQKELEIQKSSALRLVQEKAQLESQSSDSLKKSRDLEKQALMLQQEKDKLEEQNQFLKNQYVGISQEVNSLRDQYSKAAAAKAGMPPKELKEHEQAISEARRDMEKKLQEYSARMKDYEQRLRSKEDIERQNKQISEDFARLKEAYGRLERKYTDASDTVQRHEVLKDKYANLPQENATLHYNLGVLYAQNQQYERAVQEFEKVIQLKPDDIETLYNLGVIYGEHLNDRKKAVAQFKRYLALAPDDADAQRVRKFVLTWETFGQDIKDGK